MRLAYPVILTAAVLAACGTDLPEEHVPIPPPTFTLVPAVQWSGGDVTIRSPMFVDLAQLPEIGIGGDRISTTRIDDSTLGFALPVMPTQTAPVTVVFNRTAGYPAGSLDVKGFRTAGSPSINIMEGAAIVPSPSGPVALGSFPRDGQGDYGGLAVLNLRNGTATTSTRLNLVRWDLGPGPSYIPNQVHLVDSAGPAEYALFPLAYIGPRAGAAASRFSLHTSANVRIDVMNHLARVGRADGTTTAVTIEDAYRPKISTAADRVVMATGAFAPVFSASTGDSVYALPVRRIAAAVFSQDGERLFAVTWSNDGWSLSSLRSDDGTPIASVPLSDVVNDPGDLTVNQSGSLLYLAEVQDGLVSVRVIDASTLAQVGRLQADRFECSCNSSDLVPYLDAERSTLFVLEPGIPARIIQFDVIAEPLAGAR